MALVVCIVPVRKGEVKEAEAQPELEHLGEWINPRAVTGQGPPTEPGMTLWDFNRAEVEESGEKMGLRVFADGNSP